MTRVMGMSPHTVSKSRFKARALEYFRQVEKTRRPLIITDRGRAVLKVMPFADDPQAALQKLRGSVIKYAAPTRPVGEVDWEALG